MARKMALVPKELVSEYYQLNKPEIRVEDNISNLIHDEETPDDMKAKLLSHWIPKYQRLMQPSPPSKRFEIPKELLQETEVEQEEKTHSPLISRTHMIAKFISYTIPKTRKKYIIPILEKLRDANYIFNDMNELEKDGKTEYRSNGIDLFSYLMRNERDNRPPPLGFHTFLEGILNANIPIEWIGNKNVKESILLSQTDPKWSNQSSPSSLKESKPKKLSITEKLEPFSSSESLSSPIKSKPKKLSIAERLQAFSSPDTEPEKKVLKNTFSDPETSSADRKWTTWSETKRLTKPLPWKTWRS
ncbi:hypothetical protein AVEN_102719-1 [Araneus ventricosus]|uniref:Uncharacterized protein n=3 Tax=Araneus ventricosus TaxID=182803 RepID=A0A4Y2W8Z5_ARAVE|nr:hypothetical protein AVEN_102719-1 [Araneus ventricosus]